ncbi:MAG TPA: hypothetical protein EYP10_08620 [Armatimonadetes bacterium]|nr:hypothetical protein [Armatimonadota bacterium]
MPSLDLDLLQTYRARTFRLRSDLRLRSAKDALQFVNARGFVFLWPIKGVLLPNLWTAVVGERPVADAHDDPGHVTWEWKDDALDKRRWYYAKVLRAKATFIALDVVPLFYALSENFGDPDSDYIQLYRDGLMSQPAKLIYEALLREGSLDTVNLRRKIRMTSKASNSPFERGLVELQRDFKILPVGIAATGAWRYSFIYELVHRYYPDLPSQARPITRKRARTRLIHLYFNAVGAATETDVRKVFQWKPRQVGQILEELVESDQLKAGYTLAGVAGEHFVTPDLLAGM